MNNSYMCDCCGEIENLELIEFHSDYSIGICLPCFLKMNEEETERWYACSDNKSCTSEEVHEMLKNLNQRLKKSQFKSKTKEVHYAKCK